MKARIRATLATITDLCRNTARLFTLAWSGNKSLVMLTASASVVIAAVPFLRSGALALLINALVDTVQGNPVPTIGFLIVLAIGASILPDLLYTIKGYIDRRAWITFTEYFDLSTLKKKANIDIATYEDPEFNDLLSKANERGSFPMVNLLDSQTVNIQNIIGVCIASTILLIADWRVFLLICLGTAPRFIVEALYGKNVWGIYDANAQVRRKYFHTQYHLENKDSLIELKLFQNVSHFYEIVREMLVSFNKEHAKTERKKLMHNFYALGISIVTEASAFMIIVFGVLNGTIDIGTMTFLLSSINELQNSMSGFLLSIGRQYQDSLFVTDIFKVMDTKPKISKKVDGIVLSSTSAPEIIFEQVSFAYPGTTDLVLKNVSLHIKAGDKVAFVGINGAGKTTIVKLLCRFYDVTSGRILINGHDIRDIDIDSWYAQLGALFQEYATYEFPVKQGIALGNTAIPYDGVQMERAAVQGDAASFIEKWKHAYDQMIGKQFTNGIDPSKGQLQKLALSRSFYRNPRMYILDEPTASVDAESEAKIFERLESLPDDRTVLLISHRFSTVRKANTIFVIEHGVISESGTHAELVGINGTYAKLFNLQAKGYRD